MSRVVNGILALFFISGIANWVWAAPTALDDYVAKPDSNYTFNHYHTEHAVAYDTYFLRMTSQQWRTSSEVDRTLWEHDLYIVVPKVIFSNSPHNAILLVDGGDNGDELPTSANEAIGGLAVSLGSVLAVVRQVPNQPLFFADEAGRPRTEDAILAYSMDKYLDTGDPEWPVHVAMTKAAVRAMDTIQTFMETRNRIDDFILVGGSKRGWTVWLAAAVDPRVRAIVPASIDMLNLRHQFVHHWEAYGFYSPAVAEYAEFDIPCRSQTPQGTALMKIIDPYHYRDRYTMPKYLLNATGDQFFVSDSSQAYFSALPGPKWLRYNPNTDHSQNLDAILIAVSWMKDIQDGQSGPQYSWVLQPDGGIRVQTTSTPSQVRVWHATNDSARDFRLETIGPVWTATQIGGSNGIYTAVIPPPSQGWTGFMVELSFAESGVLQADQIYTTDIRVVPEALPFKGTACGGSIPVATPGLYASDQARYYLRNANADGPADTVLGFGPAGAGWIPLVGDWDGDGVVTVGLYQPETSAFYLRNSNSEGTADQVFLYGPAGAGWLPVVGDWDGDGVDTVGLYQPETSTFYLRNSNSEGIADQAFLYGPAGAGWLPVVGDWDGDGVDTVGLYQPETSAFYLRNSNSEGIADQAFLYGPAGAGWLPVAGHWQ